MEPDEDNISIHSDYSDETNDIDDDWFPDSNSEDEDDEETIKVAEKEIAANRCFIYTNLKQRIKSNK